MSEQYSQQPGSMLEIRPKFIFLAFLLFFFKPYYSINRSQPVIGRWKQNSVPVPPGRYEVAVWVSYPLRAQMGLNTVVVDVPAGASAVVTWRAPFTIFGTGKMAVAGVGPMTGSPQQPQVHQPQYQQSQYQQPQPQAQQPARRAPSPQPTQQAPSPQSAPSPQPAQAQPASAPSGWHPDPSSRHQLRYFDGTRWTEHVSDAGVQASDPIR